MNNINSAEESLANDTGEFRIKLLAPRLVALSTATILMWSYLVIGELVLLTDFAELPALLLILTLGALTLDRSELRFAAFLQRLTLRERAKHAFLALGLLVPFFFIGFAASLALPEPLVTLLLLLCCGLAKVYQLRLERRIFATRSKWQVLPPLAMLLITVILALWIVSP